MANVSYWVRELIKTRPYIAECLAQGIINNAALAEIMIPEIEEKLEKKVKFSAVNMAIRRFSEKIHPGFLSKVVFSRDSDIAIKSNLVSVVVLNKKGVARDIKEMYHKICSDRGDFLRTTQGFKEIEITTNTIHLKDLEKIFGKAIVRKIPNLCAITVPLPKDAIDTPGYIYLVTRALALDKICLKGIVHTVNELSIIVKDSDSAHSFEIIRKLIKERLS